MCCLRRDTEDEYNVLGGHGSEILPSELAERRASRQELEAFAKVLDSPVKPVCAILGGAKVGLRKFLLEPTACLLQVTDKIQLIKNMLDKAGQGHMGALDRRRHVPWDRLTP